MSKFIFSFSIILSGLTIGYLIQLWSNKQPTANQLNTKSISKRIQQICILFLSPITIGSALWIVDYSNIKLFILPLLGLFAISIGGIFAYLFGKLQKLTPEQMGAYIVSGSFTNLGSIGSLFCYIFLGEVGYALVPLYKLLEELIYYSVGFPIAKSYSHHHDGEKMNAKKIFKILLDPYMLIALMSILIGTLLNFSGIIRPAIFADINRILIPANSLLLLISIGMNMKFSKINHHLKAGLFISLIKFALIPLLATSVAYLLGLNTINNGLPLKVVYILSSMPPAFTSLIPPSLYDLDLDFANTCWMISYITFILTIPLQILTLHLL